MVRLTCIVFDGPSDEKSIPAGTSPSSLPVLRAAATTPTMRSLHPMLRASNGIVAMMTWVARVNSSTPAKAVARCEGCGWNGSAAGTQHGGMLVRGQGKVTWMVVIDANAGGRGVLLMFTRRMGACVAPTRKDMDG